MRVKVTTIGLVVVTLSIFLGALPNKSVNAQPTCEGKISLIYARGSGQKIDAVLGEEGYEIERDTLEARLNALVGDKYEFNELGSDYPAVKVWGNDGYFDGALATISYGELGRYQKSVDAGKEQLIQFLLAQKTNSCFVLSGYSQGAHVIGEALLDSRLSSIKDNIIYVGLVGDPKLDTQGYGSFFEYGKYTPWYRGNVVPFLQSGILGPRRPDYIPRLSVEKKESFTTVGSWCYDDDPICTTNILGGAIDGGHGKYAERAIPQMAQEIANEIALRTNTQITQPTCGARKQDIVLAVNMSASVRTDSVFLSDDGIEKTIKGAFEAGCDVRVGMVIFGEDGVDPVQPVLDFTTNRHDLRQALESFRPGHNPSLLINKADVTDGISMALDYQWRTDAQKAVIVMSDAPGNNYTFYGGNKLDQDALIQSPVMQEIIRKTREKGGVEIHASEIRHSSNQQFNNAPGFVTFYSYINKLVLMTAGTFTHAYRCDNCSWLNTNFSFQSILSRKPVSSVPTVRIKQGQSIDLTARDVSGGVLAGSNQSPAYSWFTDCQQLAYQTSNKATFTFSPTKSGTCYGAVMVKGKASAVCNICYEANATGIRVVTPFMIEVLPADYTDPPVPSLIQHVTKERLWDNDTLRISWDPPENADEVGELAYIVKDADGNVLGATRMTKLHIIDVADDQEPIVLINAVSGTSQGAGYYSDEAQDISSPQPSDTTEVPPISTTEKIYGVRTIHTQQAPENVLGVVDISPTQITSPVEKTQIASPAYANNSVGHIEHEPENSNIWTTLSIIAIPISAAIALGFVIKYGLLLRLK